MTSIALIPVVPVALDDDERRIAHMAASVLLDYPDEEDPCLLYTSDAADE